jgi:sterol desaturase/sphingolipid hydroxylase (fatty acid hydroxylase superfamily)
MIADAGVRVSAFVAVFAVMASWEVMAPRRVRSLPRRARWPLNLGLVALNTSLLRIVFPLGAVGGAIWAGKAGWGLLPVIGAPDWIAIPASVLLLDLATYLQHVAFHRIPVLWRVHRVHHADLDLDVTSGSRFHLVEMVLSMLIKLSVVVALGAPAGAVLVFEVLLNATAMFNHANVGLPGPLDQLLRWMVVTPDMHRVHHSVASDETNSNFGFTATWWDRLFRTYRAAPRDGHLGMTLGLPDLRDPAEQRLHRMLRLPFVREGAPANGVQDMSGQ